MVDSLKQTTGVTDDQLDAKIEENSLWELAGVLGNHELYTGNPGFRLNAADKADLKVSALSVGHQQTMVEAFKKWFNVDSCQITYRHLVSILLALSKRRKAEEVCIIVAGPNAIRPNSASIPDPINNLSTCSLPATDVDLKDVVLTTKKHHKVLFTALLEARAKYYYIGLEIGLSAADLTDIEKSHLRDSQRCLDEMLRCRLGRGGLTLFTLLTALRDPLVGRDDVAQKVEALNL